jgi:hypothetical protein
VVTRLASERFPWRRWWCPADEDPPLTSGFLDDPAGPYASWFDYALVELAQLDDVRCLVLLGEAGMGKSSELEAEEQRLQAAQLPVVRFDLGAEPDVPSLKETVLTSPEVAAWLEGSGDLVMLLDGFDEAYASLGKLPDQLLRLIGTLPADRLKVRIASRTAVWSSRLDDGLAHRWPDLQRLVLAPLTQQDAQAAAEAALGDGLAFLNQVMARDLGVLAARPLTLGLLMTVQREDGELPADRTGLYERAVTILARENHERRIEEPSAATTYPVEERLRAARRLASVSVCSGRTVIYPKRTARTPGNGLALDDIARTRQEMSVFLEVLSSGLFTAAAGGGVRWAHRTIGEFLAAQALAYLPAAASRYLLSGPLPSEQVIPQLDGVAAWVAALRPDAYQWLASRQPDLLLTASLATATDDQRRILGRALLHQLAGNEPPHDRRYFLLSWQGMGADIEPHLADDQPVWARREAARMLGDSGCRDLDGRLVAIIEEIAARHPPGYLGEAVRLAATMVFALDSCGDPGLLARLAAVAGDPGAPWQLRSDVLAELWGRLPADRLLRIIEQMNLPAQDPEFGSAVATGLSAAASQARIDLPSLVDWLGTLDFRAGAGFGDDWQQVTEAAAILAARSDDVDDAQWTIVARLAHGWLDRTGDLFTWHGTQVRDLPVDQRRRLASAILQRYPDAYTVHNLGRESRLAFDDREWWLSQTAAGLPAGSRPSHLPSAAASQEAASAPREEEAKGQGTGCFDLQHLTSAIEASDWPEAARELHLPVDRRRWPQGAPLTRAPAWLALGAATKDAATELATAYVTHLPAEPTAELMNATADALTVGDRTGWARLNPDVLVEWLKAVTASGFYDQAVGALVQAISGTRHEEVEALLLERIAQDDARRSPLHLRRLGGFNSPKIADALDVMAQHPNTAAPVVEAALAALIERAPERGVSAALRVVDRRPALKPSRDVPGEPDNDVSMRWQQSVHACVALLKSDRCADNLEAILSRLTGSLQFAADVITAAQLTRPGGEAWLGLSPDQLATLYIWAETTLPHEPDYPRGAVIDVNPVFEFSGQVYRKLADRVDHETVAALSRIAEELDQPWVRTTAARVASALQEAAWRPLDPADVRDIIDDPARQVVTTETQLAALVLQAIDQVASDVEQNPDIAAQFWDKQLVGGWIPRTENQFTTLLTERIKPKLDGVVLRQEVQLNLHYAGTAGSEPDIEAIALYAGQEISVFAEVKGIWHKDVKTSIEHQLADRYLTGARSLTGIYLVAAFASDYWADDDWRSEKARRHDPDQLRQYLEEEAERLSTDGKTVHVRVVPLQL